MQKVLSLVCFVVLLQSCKEEPIHNIDYLPKLPSHFPELVFPTDNQYSDVRWELGKRLFQSNLLSIDSTLSCASCHHADKAFTDQEVVSIGVENRLGDRNTPTLANVAFHPYYTRDGGVPSLEMQVFVPIQEHAEFDFNIVLAGERLNSNEEIVQMSLEAYDRLPDPFVITSALAVYERTIVSYQSKYDRYLTGEYNFTEEEELGYNLFKSERLGCSGCHGGFDFSDYTFANTGLYIEYSDDGRYRVTLDENDLATYKVPSLRNVEHTYPYMHNGSFGDLRDVIRHYEQEVKQHPNLDTRIKNFELNSEEREALLHFLLTLTDEEFLNNPIYQ